MPSIESWHCFDHFELPMYRLEFIKQFLREYVAKGSVAQPLPNPTHRTFYGENDAIFRITHEINMS